MAETLDQLVAEKRLILVDADQVMVPNWVALQQRRIDVVLTKEQQLLLGLGVERGGATFTYAGKKYGICQSRYDMSWQVAVVVGHRAEGDVWETLRESLNSSNLWNTILEVLARA